MAATNWQCNGKISKISGVLRDNCCETCETCRSSKNAYEGVYQEEFFKKADAFSERLQQLLMSKKIFDEVATGTRFVLFEVIIILYL